MLALILSIQFNTSLQLQIVQASGVNAYNGTTGGYTEPAELPYAGSVGRSGIIFYVVEAETELNHSFTPYKLKNGTQLKPIVFMDESNNGKTLKAITTTLNTTRNGSVTFDRNDIKPYPDGLPKPIKWDGSTWTGNGEKIGEYLLKKSGDFTDYGVELLNWEVLLTQYGGAKWQDLIDELKEADSKFTSTIYYKH